MDRRKVSLLILFVICSQLLAATHRVTAQDSKQLRPWDDYRVIMWCGDSASKLPPEKFPLFLQRLREMGVNTGMIHHDGDPKPWADTKFPYYVENIVNRGLCLKWNSKVRDWDKMVQEWRKTRSKAAFVREYCLDDPKWLEWAKEEMRKVARKHKDFHPLAYCIRDELSVTMSANPFDYDFSPQTLARFRDWLKTQYKDLDALNKEWETNFKTWDDVRPFTTDEIKNRMASGDAIPRGNPDWQALTKLKFDPTKARKNPTRWNFSPWCDFRTYMDISLARALDEIRKASHEVDPQTPVGIEGTQMPSAFGGYDLWRLSQIVDWVEPYDIGNAREIFGSFMQGKPMLTTVGESDTNHARRRLWHLLLEGDRGCIIWWSEDCIDWKSPDLALTPKAKALAPVLREMQRPLAKLFLRAERIYNPIAIHYSQASIQVDWLLESIEDGSTWVRRFSSYEATHNWMAKVRNGWLKAFQDLGYSPKFVSTEQIERGELAQYKVFVMPNSRSLSEEETKVFRTANEPRRLVAFFDATPALFDKHGKPRPELHMFPEELLGFPPRVLSKDSNKTTHGEIAGSGPYPRGPSEEKTAAEYNSIYWVTSEIRRLEPDLKLANAPEVKVNLVGSTENPRTCVHRYNLGNAKLIAFERNINWQMSEDLKQKGGNEALGKPIELEAKLAKPAHVYDLRAQQYLGETDHITFTLDPWQPSLFALLPEKIPAEKVIETLLKK